MRRLPSIIFLLIVLVLWEMYIKIFEIPIWLLPAPSKVITAIWGTKTIIWGHMLTTISETTIGFGLAILLGTGIALVMDIVPLIRRTIYPFLVISQTIPLIAIAPLLILWLGYGLLPKIIIVVLVCFFPIAISLVEGLDVADRDLLNLLKSMGASRWQIFYLVKFPHALPSLFSGLKIAATYSVMGAVVGEWLGASSGLGVYLTRASNSFLTDRVFASILVISVLSLIYFAVISLLARLLLPWQFIKEINN